ncbi:hypothetical protein EJ02DRAFT_475982 [Clathrospora elynae]|uniref:Rhodopsin domain-containing protein n=1 Tax=Clathrospora elynae TaxID=706981 RepID=A0A6A5SDV5_9PLEO|nr:hypothetical protein EJ02DRAFT_475982 [Clathrospora elynae]
MSIKPTGPGLTLLLTSITLLTISWIVVIIRIIIRTKIKGLGLDDYLMCIALILYTPAILAAVVGVVNGLGTHSNSLNEHYEQQGRKCLMFAQLFYVMSVVPVKCSISVAMIRITTVRLYKIILYNVMVLSIITCIITDITILAWCRPVAATWNPALGTCVNPIILINITYFQSASSVITDWTCAILPVFILWNVKLRYRIKLPVAIVLALGAFASAATLVRLKYILAYGGTKDYLYNVSQIALWAMIESGVGIIGGSLATFRPLLRYMSKFRDSKSQSSVHRMERVRNKPSTRKTTTCEAVQRASTKKESDAESERGILVQKEVMWANTSLDQIDKESV